MGGTIVALLGITRPPKVRGLILSAPAALIAGVSYEIIRFAGRHEANPVVRVIMAPGLALQWMTTKPPSADQIEVAIEALTRIVELEPQEGPAEKGVEVMA